MKENSGFATQKNTPLVRWITANDNHDAMQVYDKLAVKTQWVTDDVYRNQMICNDVIHAVKKERSPIILTERNEHLDLLYEQLVSQVQHLIVLKAGLSTKDMKQEKSMGSDWIDFYVLHEKKNQWGQTGLIFTCCGCLGRIKRGCRDIKYTPAF